MNGTTDLSLVPLQFIDEVELSYGLRSLKQGSGGIGGVVEFSNQTIFKKNRQLSLGTRQGSFGQRSYQAKLNFGDAKIQSTTVLYVNEADNDFNYNDLTQEGFPERKVDNAALSQQGILQTVSYRLKENQFLEANLWYFNSERNLPPLITLRDNVEFQEDENLKGLITYKRYQVEDKYKITVTSAFLKDKLNYQNQRANINSNSETRAVRSLAELKTTGISIGNAIKDINFIGQVNFAFEKVQSNALTNTMANRQELGALLQSEMTFSKKLNATVNLRYLNVLNENEFVLPSVELKYLPTATEKIYLFGLLGKNVNYPSLNDLYYLPFGNINLKAEESKSAELGLGSKLGLAANKLNLAAKVAGFYSRIGNYILWQPTAFGFWQPVNLKNVDTKGIEFDGQIVYSKADWKLISSTNYSFTKAQNFEKIQEFDESDGKQLIYIPEHKGNTALQANYKNTFVKVNYQWIGERFTTTDNTESLPAYNLLDISIGKSFKFKQHIFQVELGANNFLDVEYQAIEWRPMPNRNYFVQLNYSIK